jgi:hypothetical protein
VDALLVLTIQARAPFLLCCLTLFFSLLVLLYGMLPKAESEVASNAFAAIRFETPFQAAATL